MRSSTAVKGLIITGLLLVITLVFTFTTRLTTPASWIKYEHPYGSFNYPDNWQVTKRYLNSEEIPLHVELKDPVSGAYGFVQLWQVEGGIETIVQPPPVNNPGFSDIKISKTVLAHRNIYLLNYTLKSETIRQAKEILFQQGPLTYRLMLSSQNWTPEVDQNFMKIGKSLQLTGHSADPMANK